MVVWGEYYRGDCVHGVQARECVTCSPSAARDTTGLWPLAVAMAAILLALLGPAWDQMMTPYARPASVAPQIEAVR